MRKTILARHRIPAPEAVPPHVCPVGPIGVSTLRRRVIAPIARRPGPTTRHVFPLRLAQQTIPLSRLLRQPPHVRLCVIPTHAHNRVQFRLCKPGTAPRARAALLPPSPGIIGKTTTHVAARRAHERTEFTPRHLVFAHRKGFSDRHAMARTFILIPTFLAIR